MSNHLNADRLDANHTQQLLGDNFELNWVIGRGGMSTVWLAWDNTGRRNVAVKILKPEYTDQVEFRTRFRNESMTARNITSPNVVATYDYEEITVDGSVFCYIVMEYVRGESLADVLQREKKLPENLGLDVIAQAAEGLQAIHDAGLVHRDIKPGNLLITSDGIVKVTDFGIAKAAEAVPLTRTGMVVGTAQYVSPEQARGKTVTASSDIYSLGVVGYELLTGQRPFNGESSVSVAIKHISEEPPELPDWLSEETRELISICLRKDADQRYANGEELAAATQAVIAGEAPPEPHAVTAGSPDADAATAATAENSSVRRALSKLPQLPSLPSLSALPALPSLPPFPAFPSRPSWQALQDRVGWSGKDKDKQDSDPDSGNLTAPTDSDDAETGPARATASSQSASGAVQRRMREDLRPEPGARRRNYSAAVKDTVNRKHSNLALLKKQLADSPSMVAIIGGSILVLLFVLIFLLSGSGGQAPGPDFEDAPPRPPAAPQTLIPNQPNQPTPPVSSPSDSEGNSPSPLTSPVPAGPTPLNSGGSGSVSNIPASSGSLTSHSGHGSPSGANISGAVPTSGVVLRSETTSEAPTRAEVASR